MAAGATARRLRWALLLAGAIVVGLVLYTGSQALKAKDALEQVADDFQALSDQLTAGDRAGARTTLSAAQEHAAAASDYTRGPGWWLTSLIPGVRPNVSAVRTVADVVEDLAQDVLPAVVDASATLTPASLSPENGRIELQPLIEVTPSVLAADEKLGAAHERVRRIRTSRLAPQIADPVITLQANLAQAAELSDRIARAVQLLPPMLGADGPRTYLLLFQNNAEVRATGGIPGSFATLTADEGVISLGRQGDARTIGRFDEPPISLTSDERRLFGLNLGRFPQDVNFTPDFPRSAQLAAAMWNAEHGIQVDGVVSTDPVALSYLLAGTGPVTIADGGTLTADNAVDLLLSDVYAQIPDPARQNAFFEAVAAEVFHALASGQGRPRAVLRGLTRGASERRILVWSDDPAEQALIAPTKLGGVLAVDADAHPRVGVFLNDGTGAKLDYYLRYEASLVSRRCEHGRQDLELSLVMKSRVPQDVSTLPDYVVGVPAGADSTITGVPRGTIRTSLYLYLPIGGFLDGLQVDGEALDLNPREHDGRTLLTTTLDLAPGERHLLTARMTSGSDQDEEPVLRVTPGAHGSGVGAVSGTACS
jgi:hypothetical protein